MILGPYHLYTYKNPVMADEAKMDLLILSPSKGGDPAAGSPTATLLRLNPNHPPYLQHPPLLRVS